jgi:hypothetical protein
MRNMYEKDHELHITGAIGHVRTIDILPVVAGESLEYDLSGILRLTQLRREIVRDAQVDIVGFYRPHRHSYGDDWNEFIQGGVDETVTFTGQSTAGTTHDNLHGRFLLHDVPSTIPLWLADGYLDIYNRYFKVPTDDDYTHNFASDFFQQYGFPGAKLNHPITTGVAYDLTASNSDLNSSDWTVNIPVAGTADLDIRSLEQVQKRYKSELDKTWFSNRYNDVLETTWGSTVNTDADQRPEMLFRHTFMMSGQEVNGTDDATLGSYAGKTMQSIRCGFPRKYFPEHGAVWIMALVRWPVAYADESHYLLRTVNPTYKEIAGDPTILAAEPPIEVDRNYYLNQSSSPMSGIYEPYGNWYRYQPSVIDPRYEQLEGYPWHTYNGVAEANWYEQQATFDKMFQTSILDDFQIHVKASTLSLSPIPDPRASIYSGTD